MQINAMQYPFVVAELAQLLCDNACTLGVIAHASYLAELAAFTCEKSLEEKTVSKMELDQLIEHQPLYIHAQVTASNHRGDIHKSKELNQKALQTHGVKHNQAVWQPHFLRNELSIMRRESRFSLRAAERITRNALKWCEKSKAGDRELQATIMEQNLVELYLLWDESLALKKANMTSWRCVKWLETQQGQSAPMLHRVLILGTHARVLQAQFSSDPQEIIHFYQISLQLAESGNLFDQIKKLKQTILNQSLSKN
jgi:hypothetical protein